MVQTGPHFDCYSQASVVQLPEVVATATCPKTGRYLQKGKLVRERGGEGEGEGEGERERGRGKERERERGRGIEGEGEGEGENR